MDNIDYCLVTFFYDIGRKNWKNYKRLSEEYIESFNILLKYDYNMCIFVDDRYYDTLKAKIENSKFKKNKKLYPINESWLNKNIWSWSRLGQEREIMLSDYYKNLVQDRINSNYPENTIPEYTILTHSKIDFVNYVIENNLYNANNYGWVDFGYFHNKNTKEFLPRNTLDINKFNINKINICLINDIDDQDRDIMYTLKYSPEKIGAYFFLGNKKTLKEFQELSHKWLIKYQSLNICDDEQSLWIQCYFENINLFKKHIFYKWHSALTHFSL